MKFTAIMWKWKSGEPQVMVSCDHCRMNACMGAYGNIHDCFSWIVNHKCPETIVRFFEAKTIKDLSE